MTPVTRDRLIPFTLLLAAFAVGCTSVQLEEQYAGSLPRPEQIIVFDFAVTADEVQLDSGLSARAIRSMEGKETDTEQDKIAREVATALSKKLTAEIQKMGLPAVHELDPPIDGANTNLVVRGSFVSIDQGDRGERVAIGLGLGKSKVVIEVELVDWVSEGERVVDRFKVTAKSADNPGMAETMGAGALAGHLVVSAVVSTGVQTASEHFGSSVEADTSRAAKNAAKVMKKFFVRQGWIED
jgi:hypothetical protein